MPKKKKIKWKSILGLGGISLAAGGCWLAVQVYSLTEKLNQAMPMNVMTGINKKSMYIYLPENVAPDPEDQMDKHLLGFRLMNGLVGRRIHPRTSWELVFLASAKERHHKLLGLHLLSTSSNLNDSICREIAQASDFHMAVGLARSKHSDLRLLLSPPPLPPVLKLTDLQDDCLTILKSMPLNGSNQCVTYLTQLALQKMQHSPEVKDYDWWSFGSVDEVAKQHSKLSKAATGLLFLNSMLAHSAMKDHCKSMMNLKILPVLMKLYNDKSWTQNIKTQSLIAKILGNLALEGSSHYAFFQSGWISVIARWARNSDLELALTSERILANLDELNGSNKLENGIYVAHPCNFYGESNVMVDVIFIHGLLGGAFKTWRQHDMSASQEQSSEILKTQSYTHCWPRDWLAKDLPQIRVILIDYETHLTEWGSACPYDKERSLEARSKILLTKLMAAGVGRRPIIWVSHSMGGLLMKQMLVLSKENTSSFAQQILKQTKGAIFFSVPHRGSKIAMPHFASQYLIFPSPEVKELHYGSQQLLHLHQQYVDIIDDFHIPCLSFCETKNTKLGHLNLSAKFVSQDSANINLGEFYSMDSDHLYICKPTNQESFTYQRVVEFIKQQIKLSGLESFEIFNQT